MPDYGRLTQELLPHTSPAVAPFYPPPPWPLPGARILKLLFETDTDPVLTWLPPKLSRSSPPYATIAVAHYPSSPVGPFTLAAQYIGCRAGMFIRAFTVQAIVDSAPAVAALREVWGMPCKLGEATLTADPGTFSARVSRGDSVLAELSLEDGSEIAADSVRFDPVLNLRAVPSLEEGKRHDLLQMVQIDPDYQIKESQRGRGQLHYPAQSAEDPWHVLPMRNMISAVYCVVDTELPLARFVMQY